jgi:ABC-2 type transport system ATP-binding protein
MIEVRDLRVDYGDFCALRDCSFRVGPGEVVGLIGPNGSGKTTTFRAILGLLDPTFGEITVDGVNVRDFPETSHRVIGYMPDFVPLYEELTVREFLDLFAASYYIPKADRPKVIDEHLELVDLTEKRNELVGGLSRGMRQRMMLAKTLLPDPKILLLDEPASGVDPYGRIMLKQVLQQVAARGKAVMVSSHILSEMEDFCTGVLIMEKGRLVVGGRIDEVADQVMGTATWSVGPLNPTDQPRLKAWLENDRRCQPVSLQGDAVVFGFAGDEAEAAGLLVKLVGTGIPITQFGRRRGSLEEVFLKVNAREVS